MLFIWLIKLTFYSSKKYESITMSRKIWMSTTVLNFYVIRNWIVYEGINNKKNVLSTKSAY